MSRTHFAIKNLLTGVFSKIILLILGFVSRTIFIYYLGNEYLGINGLYTEILNVLSFAELGFGSAMTYAMYKPVAKNDRTMIIKLLKYYKKIYTIIAFTVLALGLLILPFLQDIINNANSMTLFDLRLYYGIFLFNTVVGYFVTFKFSLVNAFQKNYIVTNIDTLVKVLTFIFQIVFLVLFKSFIIYLIVQSILLLISRIIISIYLNKEFPILKEKCEQSLSKEEKAPIISNVKALMIHQFSSIAVHSTDNIIISMFTGLGVVAIGIISNYTLLMRSVLGFAVIIFTSIASSFGNLVAESTTEKFKENFLKINFLSFWIYGFCSIAFFLLLPPFITLWIGEENLIDTTTFLLIIINGYMQGQSTAYHNVRIAKGEFQRDKWLGLVQAIVNLVISVIGAKLFGLVGVYIGTVISRLVYVCTRPLSTYRFLFNESASEYYKTFIKYFIVVFFAGILTFFATESILSDITFVTFSISCCIVLLIPNIVFAVLFYKTKEFKQLFYLVKNIKGVLKNGK